MHYFQRFNSAAMMLATAQWLFCSGACCADPGAIRFSRDVLPILSENCFFCHGPDEQQRQGDLRLDTEAGARAAISHNPPMDSPLLQRVLSSDPDLIMPPPDSNRSLTAEQKQTLTQWISSGAEWGRHWSFEPLVQPDVPEAAFSDVPVHNPIDAFVQARLAEHSLKPSEEADRSTLLRRVTLDLTGLPPTPEELRQFLADDAADAWERTVERLLHSEAYGERMAWDWLNAARYADTNGYQGDRERTMWPWRDWVVTAFNRNMPYDQFSTLQLAGDLLPAATFEQKLATGFCRNHMINGEGGRIAEENRVDYVMDMSETMGTVWLGLTLNCCRCHDHKYDPLTQHDYYQFYAFFNQTPISGGGGDPQTAPTLPAPTAEQRKQLADFNVRQQQLRMASAARATTLEPQQAVWEQTVLAEGGKSASDLAAPELSSPNEDLATDLLVPPADRTKEQADRIRKQFLMQDAEYARLTTEVAALTKQIEELEKSAPRVMVMADRDEQRTTFVLNRGLYNSPTDQEVRAATPASLPTMPIAGRHATRLDLANWLFSKEHPLTARVTVNRFWQQVFGVGLVKTVEDFGVQGQYPVHQELLNWLAADFRDHGWDVKRLMKTIVLSHTYRQCSEDRPAGLPAEDGSQLSLIEADPENQLLGRAPRYRMPAWMLRDQALAVSGLLNDRIGGKPVNTYQPAGVWEEATFGNKTYRQDTGDSLYRRSLYIFWRRIIAPTMLFDNASRQTCTVKMVRTNTPLHSLLTFNETTYVEAARHMAQSLLTAASAVDDPARLREAFLRVLCRVPSDAEEQVMLAGLRRSRGEYAANPEQAAALLAVGESPRNETIPAVEHAAWTAACLTLLNLDEALNRE